MIAETLTFAALFVNGTPSQRGGPIRRYGQQARVAGGAVAGGAKGAVKGAKKGAKVGGAAGKATGAGIGAAAGSVLPGAGTAAGARIGGAIGQVAGKGIGAGIGAGIGGAKGAHDGAAKARERQLQRQQQQNAMRQVKSAVNTLKNARNFAASPQKFAFDQLKNQAKKHRRGLLGALIAIIFFCFTFLGDLTGMNQPANLIADQGQTQTNPLQITKTGPTTGTAGQPLQYSITVFYPGSADDVVITDPLPEGASYVSSCAGTNPCKSGGTFAANTVTWDAKKLKLPLTDPISITVGLTVKSKQNNVYVINYATASVSGGLLADNGATGGNVAANQNTCSGKYTLNTPYGNFGDPQCNFTTQALGTLLKQLDPANALTWECIAQNESTNVPNAYNPNSKSGNGAYGLFQMNPTGKGNDQYDDGTVNWPVQTSNAINYRNKEIKGSWAYWAGDGCV